jgi:hypothetical protein
MEKRLKLHKNQGTVFTNLSRFRVLVAGRRFGKSTLAVNELYQNALLYPKSLNWYVGPTYTQTKMIAWRMLVNLLPREHITKTNESELYIRLFNGSEIFLKGSDNEDSLRGVGVSFVVLDEFALMKNTAWGEVIRPMLIDTGGRALFIGTPKGQNHFYDLFQKGIEGEENFKSFKFTSYDNPYIDPHEIEQMRQELPDNMFQQEVMCSFLVGDANMLIHPHNIESLKGLQIASENRVLVTCDPSEGGDECVIYVLNDTEVVEEKFLHYNDTMKIAGELIAIASKHKAQAIVIDKIGMGKGIVDRLNELLRGSIRIIPINSSEKALEEARFYNKRAEIWWTVLQKIINRELAYPKDVELRRQLCAVRYKVVDSTGKIQLEPKSQTKKDLGRSPDRADAYVYGIYALEKITHKPRIESLRQPVLVTKDAYGWNEGRGEYNAY